MKDIKIIAKELVIRSRAGDQNASAMIMEVAKAAKRGVKQAVISDKAISEYIEKNPIPESNIEQSNVKWDLATTSYVAALQSGFNGEAVIALVPLLGEFATTTLANGPKLTNDIINLIGSEFGSDNEEHAFMFGVKNSEQADKIKQNIQNVPQSISAPLVIGCNVGEARRIQMIRNPNVPLSVYSKQVASELGDL